MSNEAANTNQTITTEAASNPLMMPETTSGQRSLFQYARPGSGSNLERFTQVKNPKFHDDGTLKSAALTLISTKEIKSITGLKGKENESALAQVVLKVKDELKTELAREVVGIVADPAWTGSQVRRTVSKSGKAKVAVVFESVNVANRGPSIEECAAKLGLTVEEVREMVA